MKAITFTRYREFDSLRLEDVPKPVPKEDELRVRVHASSVNSWDWEYFNGTPFVNRLMFGLRKPRPGRQRLGADIAGTVESVGGRVTRFKEGDAVFGDLWDRWGGFAQYACIPESSVQSKPDTLSFEQAAAVPQAGILALQGLRKFRQIRPGHKVLINGAGGGVGSFAIQLARMYGAMVTGVDAAHKLDFILSLGAQQVIDCAREDYTERGERYDLIVDCQNNRSMFDIRRALAEEGVYAMIGGSMGRVYQLWILSLLARFTRERRTLCLVAEGPNKGLDYLKDLLQTGKLVPALDRSYPLHQVAEALRYFGEGVHTGKITIRIDAA